MTLNTKKFLKELTDLSVKHKIKIAGCGCCGSPYLVELKEQETNYKYTVDSQDDGLEMRRIDDLL